MAKLRNAVNEDAGLLFNWANDAETRNMSVNSAEIKWEGHVKWFEKRLEDASIKIFVLEENENAVGQIRFENKNDEWLIGYSIAADFRGKGFGRTIVALGMEKIGSGIFIAFVKPENLPSLKIFLNLGFENMGTEEQDAVPLVKFKLEKQS